MMTTVAVAMSDRLFVNFQRAERQLRYQQAFWYSQGVEALAEVGLKESFKDNDKVTLNQPWAVKDQTYPLDLGTATGSVYDRQACYNVNALNNVGTPENGQLPYEVAVLQRLFENLELDGYQAETAAASVWEFVDGDNSVQTALGVEDSHYEGQAVPYVTANGPLADNTELRAINGISAKIYNEVAPMLCAVPSDKLNVNINTLTEEEAPLLAALTSISTDQAKELIEGRPYEGWDDVDSFLAEPALASLEEKAREQIKPHLDVTSHFFELDALIEVDKTTLRLRTLLARGEGGNIETVRRRFGGMRERDSDDTSEQ
ncbi:type II secretion system minor pseudopilin GspK [Parasalinivibrio latis]